MLIGIATGENQKAQDKVIGSLAKTIDGNRRIANQVFETRQSVFAKFNGNVYQPVEAIVFDREKYDRVIVRIIKGLYWMQTSRALSGQARIIVIPGDELEANEAGRFMSLMHELPLHKLNKDTFFYRFHIYDDDKSIWGLQFFGRHITYALVNLT